MSNDTEYHSESGTLIFVYGTLKRGFRRSRFLENQTFLAEAVTAPHYCLYDCGEYPGLVLDQEAGCSIHGELWCVDEIGLKLLDEVEGVAQNLYSRHEIELISPAQIQVAQAYYYQGSVKWFTKCGSLWTKGREK